MTAPVLQRAGLLCRGSACGTEHLCVFQSKQHPEALDMKINGDVSVCVLEKRIIFLLPIHNPHASPSTLHHIHASIVKSFSLADDTTGNVLKAPLVMDSTDEP